MQMNQDIHVKIANIFLLVKKGRNFSSQKVKLEKAKINLSTSFRQDYSLGHNLLESKGECVIDSETIVL